MTETGTFVVEDAVAAALGKTKEEIASMMFSEFVEAVYALGGTVRVAGKFPSENPGLAIRMEKDDTVTA